MKEIVVGKENSYTAFVDDEYYPLLSQITWYPLVVRNSELVYAQRNLSEGCTELMHHLVFGRPQPGMVIDHINGNGLDNRKENLQYLPNAENIRKRYTDNPDTGIKLRPAKIENPWQAQVSLGGKTRHVGYFPTKELAKEARDQAIEDFLSG